jgi:hypothetical protein
VFPVRYERYATQPGTTHNYNKIYYLGYLFLVYLTTLSVADISVCNTVLILLYFLHAFLSVDFFLLLWIQDSSVGIEKVCRLKVEVQP